MTRADIVMMSIVAIGLGFFGWLVFFAPEAPELGYRNVEVAGTSFGSVVNTSMTHIDYATTLVRGGFVTAHQAIGTAPGPIVGISSYLEPGTYNQTLVVAPSLVADAPYVLLVHVDDGDGEFVVEKDLPVTSDGQVVRGDFNATNIVAE